MRGTTVENTAFPQRYLNQEIISAGELVNTRISAISPLSW